jgi:hypothetical protein
MSTILRKAAHYRILFILIIAIFASIPGFKIVAAATDVGIKDFSYLGATADTGAMAPSGQKPQSKLWNNDGIWWGVLFNRITIRFEIYRLDWATQTWASTGVVVDSRSKSSADALWDGTKLYIVSAVPPEYAGANNSISLMRYSYNAITKSYSLDSGFPVTIAVSAIETVVMDKDSTGRLWITYTDDNGLGGRRVLVTHSTTNDYTWLTPFEMPTVGANNLNIDDISTLVAYSDKIGVMWSNQTDSTVYFAIHNNIDPDSTWTLNPAMQGPKYADDHMNIKSLQADPSGQVFAVVKTSLSDNNPPVPTDPLILLLKLDTQGAWTRRTFGTVADNHTRPIVLIDQQNREIYVFATVQYSGQFSGAIYYKKISLDNNSMQFPTGLGTPFIEFAADSHINNSTSTKQPLNSIRDLVVLASDDNSHYYFHNVIDLSPSGSGPLLSDGFESGNFSAWTENKAVGGGTAVVQSTIVKTGSFAARMTEGTKTASRAYIRTVLAVPQTEITAIGNFMITQEGASGGNVPIFKLLNASGGQILSLYRKNLDSNRVYVSDLSTTRLTSAVLPLNTWGKFELYVKTAGTGTSTIEVYLNDVLALSTTTANLGAAGVSSVLLGNDIGGQQFNLVADDVVVRLGSTRPQPTATPSLTPTSAFSPTATFTPVVSTFFNDGLESGSYSAWDLATAGGDGSVSVQTGTVRNGTYAALLSATGNVGSDAFARKIMTSPETDLTATGYFMVTQEGVTGANIPIFRLFDLSGNRLISLYRQNLDLNKVYFTDLSGAKTIVAGSMPLNTWVKFDLHVITSGNGTSTLDIYLNSVLAYRSTTASLGISGVSVVQIGNDTSRQTFSLFADDVSISRGFVVTIPTATPTPLPVTATSTPTATLVPPTATPTATSIPATATNTPTATALPPTATATSVPPTETPTPTAELPTATSTPEPATATLTAAFTETPTQIAPTPTAAFNTLFSDGFESGDFSAWTSVTTGGNGSAAVQGSVFNAGSFAAQFSETNSTGSLAYVRKRLAAAETNLTITGYYMVTQEGATGGNVPFLRIYDSSGARLLTFYRQNLDNNRIYAFDGVTRYLASGTVPLNTWVKLELHVITAGTGASTIQVYLNDVLVLNTTSASMGTSGVLTVQLGNDTAKQTSTLFVDDINIHN